MFQCVLSCRQTARSPRLEAMKEPLRLVGGIAISEIAINWIASCAILVCPWPNFLEIDYFGNPGALYRYRTNASF